LCKTTLGFTDCAEELRGALNHEKQWLNVVDLKLLAEDFIEDEGAALAIRTEGIGAIGDGRDEPAAVDANFAALADEAELDGEPEEAGEGAAVGLSLRAHGDLAEALEEVSEDGVGVHGDVSEDVMEDVGFGKILELFHIANDGGGGKAAVGEALEKKMSVKEAVDGDGGPSGERLQALVHESEVRDGGGLKTDGARAGEKFMAGDFLKYTHATLEQKLPDRMLTSGVGGPVLRDEVAGCGLNLAVSGAHLNSPDLF